MEEVFNHLTTTSNDINKIRSFFEYVKMVHNLEKCSGGCPLGHYLIEIEEEILKKSLSTEDQSSNFIYISNNFAVGFWAVFLLRKKIGIYIQFFKRSELIKEIDLAITKAEKIFF